MRLAIVATLLVMASGVAVVFFGHRAANRAGHFEAQLLGAWPDARRTPARNRDSEIVFDELVIRARPQRQKLRKEPRLPRTASR